MDDFTNKYPYTDFHEMNLDWFLDHFDDVMKMIMQNNETVKGLIEYIHSLGLVVIDDNTPAPDKVYSSQKTQNLLNDKVDKVAGYGLSQNDFTNTLKNKLDGIEAGANRTVVADTMSAYQTDPVEGGVIFQSLNAKVDKVAGKQLSQENFTSTLKTKLDGIEAGANRTVVDDHLDADSLNPVENGVITNALGGIIDDNAASLDTTYSSQKIESIIPDPEDLIDDTAASLDTTYSSQKIESILPDYNYYTTEKDTGIKWIDGKSIYQKTIYITNGLSHGNNNYSHNISNIEQIIDFEAYRFISDGGAAQARTYGSDSSHQYTLDVQNANKTYIVIWLGQNFPTSGYDIYVTLRYTKSTI